ncbi:MAG: sugar ABC transporter substrate-binding protein [Chloroflexi bacterium]|nr:sugar ABC transporter substrate-binding protein [Chloroflexota bacterium]
MPRKKWVIQSLVLLLIVLITVQCAAPAAPQPAATEAPQAAPAETEAKAPEPVTIEWWTVNSEEYTEQVQRDMAKVFEASHPNIKINVTVLPEGGFSEKMTTALGAGQGAPDVAFFWDSNWFPEALDLTPYIEADPDFDPSMYIEGFWKTRALWQDKVVGLPLGVGAQFVMYNKDVFDEMGVDYPTSDWTTDDYLKLVVQLNDPAKKRWGGDRPRRPYRAIWFNYGPKARLYSDDSTTVDGYLNSDQSVAAYTWAWDLVNTDSTPTPADIEILGTEGTGPVDLFMAGRLAMATLNQGHMLNAVKAGVNFGVVPEPGVAGNERWVNAWSLTSSIWKGTKHPDEAWEFLSWWVGPEGQRYLMENGNLFPSIQSVLDEYEYADTDYAQAFFKVLELRQVSEWRNAHPCNSTVLRAVGDVWDKIMLNQIGRDEIKAELDAAVPTAQSALDECRVRLGG